MTGSKGEWLEWDRRFQFGYSCLNQRLTNTEEATHQIAQLEQQTKLLAANSKHLEEANDAFKNKIQKLEQTSYQIAQFNEQIQELTASSRVSKEENNVLDDRILQLEQEGTHRDEENRLVQQQLKEKLDVQEETHRSVIISIRGMHSIAKAERDQRGEEIQRLRSQVEALIATRSTPGGDARDAFRGTSAATTDDERVPISQHAKQQPTAAYQDMEIKSVPIKAQRPFTLFESHLRYAERAFRRYESEAVQAFVSGVQEDYRTLLGNKLGEHGEWTWEAAREESYRILDNEKKAKRRSARLLAASSQPS